MKKAFKATIVRDGAMCFIPVPFDPKPVFGKTRAPVKVSLNGYTYRSTISAMGNGPCVPLRRSNREAAGVEGGETLRVTLELDTDKREVKPPADLVKALKSSSPAWDRWRELSYSHQREYVEAIEAAKKPETRARRIEGAARTLAARGSKPPSMSRPKSSDSSRPRLNAAWHERHPMPKKPTMEQRLAWHREHEEHCGCRPMPAKLRAMAGRGRKNGAVSARRQARSSPAKARRYAAFLRGVSPMNAKMPELKSCFEAAGFTDVTTVLASGNVVFSARAASEESLEHEAEAAMQERLGRTFLTIVRPLDALREFLDSDPYGAFRLSPRAKRVVTFVREKGKTKLTLPIEIDGARILSMKGGEIFSAYLPSPRGPVFMALIEKTFGKDVTTRTWDTVKKVAR